jgi:Ca2+-dependent lipid-binding protein
MDKLAEMYKTMHVDTLAKNVREYREEMSLPTRGSSKRLNADAEGVSGQFKIQIAYAENLKPCNANGLAYPYVLVKVPEGTVAPVNEEEDEEGEAKTPVSASVDVGPVILSGKDCEMARSRYIADSLNPTWDETFQCILPLVDRLEIMTYSRNLITSDELMGQSSIDLGRLSRMKRKLEDHQTHDTYLELDPQGRVLIRLTLEGGDEDVDFWFRRGRERLGRMRDDYVRALTAKVCVDCLC